MKNKKTFELPEYFSLDANNSVLKDSIKARGQAEDHLNLLKQQAFCLNLMEFFTKFPNVYELKLSIKYNNNYNGYTLNVFINKKEEDWCTTMFAYLKDTISYLDMEKIVRIKDQHLIVKKDNIHAAWEEWVGKEHYQKWKCLDMEDKPRKHTKPTGEYKQKKENGLKMKNKKTFELPEYLPMITDHFVQKFFMEAAKQVEDHLDLLKQQAFCLNLIEFFIKFPNAYELKLSIKYNNYNDYNLNIFINGKEDEGGATYFEDTLCCLDMEKLVRMKDQYLIVKKDNIHAAWEEWMGEENYQKWKCLDMEDKLREHIKPTGEYKQKIKRI